MIEVNGKAIELKKFPDGTFNLNGQVKRPYFSVEIIWKFENNEELVALWFIAKHIENCYPDVLKTLIMPYCSNARMDRVKNDYDIFTLKYFSEMINAMHFNEVKVLDPHSPVSEALINNLSKYPLDLIVEQVMDMINEDVVVCYPDSGAYKRYEDFFKGYQTCYAIKHRDWETGEITELEMITNGIDLKDKTVLLVDDLISYGGSLYFTSLELKKLGVKCIYAYVSHTENSILDKEKGTLIKLLENGTVEKLFTTDSLFTGEHEKIEVIELYGL